MRDFLCVQKACPVYFEAMDHLSTENFRASMGKYLDRIYFQKERFVITRNGAPFVKIIPVPPDINPGKVRYSKAKEIRINTSELFGSVHFQGEDLLILRRGKPTALVTTLRHTSPGIAS